MDLAITLSEGEYRVLKEIVKQKRIDIDRLAAELGLPKPSVAAYVELLASKNLVKVIEEKYITIKITNEGRKWINKFPEEVLIEKLEELGGKANIKDLISLLGKENATIALSWAKKRGWIEIVHGNVYLKSKGKVESQRQLLLQALRGVFFKKGEEPHNTIEELKRRKMIEIEELTRKIIEVTDKGINAIKEAVVEVGVLTSDIIASGRWRAIKLKPYNVEAEPPRIYPGRKHFFIEFLEEVRRILHEMGFEEMRSYYVETEFWNFDVLFQAQDHPAREVHDTFHLKYPSMGRIDHYKDIVERVKIIHETGGDTGSRGWGYKWSPEIARRLVLRSQTTSASARYLYEHREPPVRAYIIGKVFRPDEVSARRLPEFYQFDGIVMEKDLTFRNLLGIIKQFFAHLGIKKLKFKPAYFPFTEPSAEGYVYIEGLGWIEVFGAGMFRPEVLAILGVKYPVAAWGMGLERIAMAFYGINDIRLLYTSDLSILRQMKVKW